MEKEKQVIRHFKSLFGITKKQLYDVLHILYIMHLYMIIITYVYYICIEGDPIANTHFLLT